MNPVVIAVVSVAFLAGWALTGAARRYALARRILDTPNERSSHAMPTPLGGGWGIAVPVLGAVALAGALGWLDRGTAIGVGGGALAVALVGWIDDRVGLSVGVRLLVQIAAAAWVLGWVGGFRSLDLGVAQVPLGPWGNALAVLAIVWCTNLYNFMDGIDGIAGAEAVSVASVGGALLLMEGANGLALVTLATAAASAGFLIWNRPPARIFMGDAGSALLGFLFAAIALAADGRGALPALVWVLLLGAFVGDATIVLLRRMARRERWYSGHRDHLYQRLVQSGWTHGRVDRALLVLNVVLSLLGMAAWRWRAFLLPAVAMGSAVVAAAYVAAERRLSRTSGPEPAE